MSFGVVCEFGVILGVILGSFGALFCCPPAKHENLDFRRPSHAKSCFFRSLGVPKSVQNRSKSPQNTQSQHFEISACFFLAGCWPSISPGYQLPLLDMLPKPETLTRSLLHCTQDQTSCKQLLLRQPRNRKANVCAFPFCRNPTLSAQRWV